MKKLLSALLAASTLLSISACGGGGGGGGSSDAAKQDDQGIEVPYINEVTVGEDFKDLTAEIKILTDRTDVVDTVYADYVRQFNEIYPNIKVNYEAVTDYENSVKLRLTTGDWGDICYISTGVTKADMSKYFTPLGTFDELDPIYNYMEDKSYDGIVYGIANGGVAQGVVYNKRIWKEAGITELPKTPDEFLEDLKTIKEKTDAIPLYTNFAGGWPVGAWDGYITGSATGDADFHNNLPHMKDPFSKREDMTGPYAVYYTLYEAVARGLVEEDPASTDWESSKSRINTGEIATMVLGSWAVNQCRDAGPTPDDVGYMPFPITVNGQQYVGSAGNYCYGINCQATSQNQAAAMVYLKWLLEESPIFVDEGSIPALKSAPKPEALADLGDLPLIVNNPAPAGEEDLFDNVNLQSEVGINSDDYPDINIIECALTGSKSLDDIMKEWNEKWSAAQESLGVEVNK